MTDKKVARVEILYEDGTGIYVDGKDATKWSKAATGQGVFCANQAAAPQFPKLDWKRIKWRPIPPKPVSPLSAWLQRVPLVLRHD